MSFFQSLSTLPEDPIFSLNEKFKRIENPKKVNLGMGIYKSDEGISVPFRAIQKAEENLLTQALSKDYLPIDGNASFTDSLLKVIFGGLNEGDTFPNIYAAQCIGGTGGLRLGAELINRELSRVVYIPEISWPNHAQIFRFAGMVLKTYPYAIDKYGELDFFKICQAFEKMPPGSLVVLHACCHNPTGVDFTLEQWMELSALIKKRNLLPFFDFAYHGFGISLDKDAEGLRYFYSQGHEMMVSYSCSKNFGLYGERLGMLAIVTKDEDTRNVSSHVKSIIRTDYSNPPIHGSRLVTAILQSEALTKEWKDEVDEIRKRCQKMRKELAIALSASPHDFSFLLRQHGLFSLTGLTKDEVYSLREQYGIVMPDNGRINIAALTDDNIAYVASSIIAVYDQLKQN